jgi:hypothetical protein
MTYDKAMKAYLDLRTEVERAEAAHKAAVASMKSQMLDLETWITMKAQEDGIDTIKSEGIGTVYWSTHHSCTVASRDAFFAFVRDNNAFDLLENRASKTAVKSFIEANGEAPPGVTFSSIKAFNLRRAGDKDK